MTTTTTSTMTDETGSKSHASASGDRYREPIPNIQLEDVPSEVHAELSRRAAKTGKSFDEYLKDLLVAETKRPLLRDIFDEIEQQGYGGTFTADEIAELIREDRDSH